MVFVIYFVLMEAHHRVLAARFELAVAIFKIYCSG
jgi:hypothetical protein